jgi:hypothetical protein
VSYLILVLATWRIASLLANESGPFDLFDRIRFRTGVYYDDYGNPQGNNELSRAITCVWCSSIWIAAALTVLYWQAGETFLWVLLPLAVSAASIIVEFIVKDKNL